MKFKLFSIIIFFIPLFLGAMTIEEEAGKILGQSYKGEAARAFFKKLNLKTDFPERSTFTYNFYDKGLSIKINGGEFIQAIQVYNQTMLFKTFPQNVYGKKLSDVYDLNDIYKVVKMAPLSEDKASGTFIYPNKKPADYLIRVVRKPDNTMRAIAWMMDENTMEKIIAKAIKPISETRINSHDAIWTMLGTEVTPETKNKLLGDSFVPLRDAYGDPVFNKENGVYVNHEILRNPRRKIISHIEFKRRGQFGTVVSFPHALPEGLFWWSSPDDFSKVLTLKASKPEVGAYIFEKESAAGRMTAVFSMGMLSYVRFNAKEEK